MIQLNIPGADIRRRNHNICIVGVFDYQITSSYSGEICSIDDIRRRAYSRPLDYACLLLCTIHQRHRQTDRRHAIAMRASRRNEATILADMTNGRLTVTHFARK